MNLRKSVVASLVVTGLLASTSQAQVMQLGRIPTKHQVAQTSCNCSEGGGLLDKFRTRGGCETCGGASSGMAGEMLGDYVEPDCGTAGLGYAGGFGYCGSGDCGACGVGGYFGRNLHQVNPCACGGSLIGDLARGTFCVVDKTVGCVVGSVCGGLRAVTCHASGSLAALECAAKASCHSCHGAGCDVCGEGDFVEYAGDYYQPTPAGVPMHVTPAEPNSGGAAMDPFLDDPPAPTPQARRTRYPGVQPAAYLEPSSIHGRTPSRATTQRYLNPKGRAATLRR